jgi:hypothetical protein
VRRGRARHLHQGPWPRAYLLELREDLPELELRLLEDLLLLSPSLFLLLERLPLLAAWALPERLEDGEDFFEEEEEEELRDAIACSFGALDESAVVLRGQSSI